MSLLNVMLKLIVSEAGVTSKGIRRSYAFKSNLKIKWVHPGKIPCTKPAKSGDLTPMPIIDQSRTQLEFEKSRELSTANDAVKKLFSLEFAPRIKSTHAYIKDTVDTVKRHDSDKGSVEVKIAHWTAAIRSMQDVVEKYPKNIRYKVQLKELIDKRKKHLKYLRRWDYKKFEWLIEKLAIVYKPPPNEFHWITRKGSLRKLTDKYCRDLVDKRLDEYRKQLREEQPMFLEEKIALLKFIRKEEQECGVQVTITEDDIEIIEKQLAKLIIEEHPKVDRDN